MDDLKRLMIEHACGRLVSLYCHHIDHGEAGRVAELFSEDGVWSSAENTMTGRDAVRSGFMHRQDNKGRMSRHICNNLLIDVVDEERATGVVYVTIHRHDGDPERRTSPASAPSLIGEYRDEFTRTAEGWRFRRRDILVNFV